MFCSTYRIGQAAHRSFSQRIHRHHRHSLLVWCILFILFVFLLRATLITWMIIDAQELSHSRALALWERFHKWPDYAHHCSLRILVTVVNLFTLDYLFWWCFETFGFLKSFFLFSFNFMQGGRYCYSTWQAFARNWWVFWLPFSTSLRLLPINPVFCRPYMVPNAAKTKGVRASHPGLIPLIAAVPRASYLYISFS